MSPTATTPRLAVLYENSAWMTSLFEHLDGRGVAYDAIDLSRDAPPTAHNYAVVFNRVSPSASSRGHGAAIDVARAWLPAVEDAGTTRVVNGTESFTAETSKQRQHEIIRGLGLHVPRSAVPRDAQGAIHTPSTDFPFPAIVKPDTGGSGEGVRFVGSRAELERVIASLPTADEDVLLLQQFVTAPLGEVMRLEFIGGELVYAMRVQADNTFNLCPAEGCERPATDDEHGATVRFDHAPDLPREVIDESRAIVRAAGLDVGGVEYIQTHDGTRFYFDINATSSYRADVSRDAGVNAMAELVDYLEGEIASADRTLDHHQGCGQLLAA